MSKFYTFNQNNSGGYFIKNDDVAQYLIIEADNEDEAVSKMWEITEDYSEYCSCCGERWSSFMWDEGSDVPNVNGVDILAEPYDSYFGSDTIIYYKDGRKVKLYYED